MNSKEAQKIARLVLDDLTDRRGFRQAWDDCDRDTRKEMRDTVARIIEQAAT